MKIGVMFGNPETTTGGNALKFYASVRWTSGIGAIKRGDEVVGNGRVSRSSEQRSRRRSVRRCSTSSTAGASRAWQIIRLGVAHDIIESPAPGTRTTARSARGEDNTREFLREHLKCPMRSRPDRAAVGVPFPVLCVRVASRRRGTTNSRIDPRRAGRLSVAELAADSRERTAISCTVSARAAANDPPSH
jgi:hypothetical protein